eukprot:2135047-Prymnesium_polylepis.1
MCPRQGAGDRMCTAVPTRCGPRHRAGMSMCRNPPYPACLYRGDELDPRRCGVAARTGPGVLWW